MKISWNWGTKLVIAIILWISFILIMVIRMVQVDVPLVEEDYYPKAVAYQSQIDKRSNANALNEPIRAVQTDSEISLVFPSDIRTEDLSGAIWIYRPSAESEDFHYTLAVDSTGTQSFAKDLFHSGRYIFKIDFKDSQKSYYQEVKINIH